jgi:hypothetical protein
MAGLQSSGASPQIPRTIKTLWPWFVFGTPLVCGLIDVFLIQSTGNVFVQSNSSWLSHAPLGVNVLAAILWLFLISMEILKRNPENKAAVVFVLVLAAPLYQALSWWTTALVSTLINISLGFQLPNCDADIVRGQVSELFEKRPAKPGDANVRAVIDTHQQWGIDRIRMCTGKLAMTNGQSYSVRFKIEDHGSSLFRNTMHGLYISEALE